MKLSRYFKWFNDIKMFSKQMILFACVAVIFLGISYLGLSKIKDENKVVNSLNADYIQGEVYVYEADLKFKDIRLMAREATYKAYIDNDSVDVAKLRTDINNAFAEVEKNIDAYGNTALLDEESAALKEFKEAYPTYKDVIGEALQLLESKKYNEAYAFTTGDGLKRATPTINAINKMTKVVVSAAAKVVERSNEEYSTVRTTFISIMFLGLSLIFAICFVIARSISKPVNKLVDVMAQVENGNLTANLNIDSKDEIGHLAVSFNNMVTKQREVVVKVLDASSSVSSASEEISSTTEELTSTAQDQANSVEEFTATVEQMDTSIQDLTNNINTLASNVSNVSSSIGEMGASVQDTAENVEETAAAINQVAASIVEMNDSIKSIANHTKDAQQEATTTVNKANEGNITVNNTVEEMSKIYQAVQELSSAVKELGSSAERIGEIVNVIDDIAEQTNLLSLNAAIEAARAGDAGKGFAVVANSIRGLAERSSEATKDIGKLIKGIQSEVKNAVSITNDSTGRVQEGVQLVKNTGQVFEDIFGAIGKTSTLIQEISAAMDQQEAGSKEIAKAVEKMSDLINHLSATTEEQAAGTDEVVKSMERINDLMQQMSATTEQQAASSQEVVRLIQGINSGTAEVSAGSEEIASSSTHLAEQAQGLLNLVSMFKVKAENEANAKIISKKLNCWEYKNCGREPGGTKSKEMGVCPAATFEKADGFCDGKNGGRSCMYITGTYCGGQVQGTYKDKAKQCEECEFYKQVKKECGSKLNVFTFDKYIQQK